jgi:hypothetical protein
MTGIKIFGRYVLGMQQQMQIRSIDIQIANHMIGCQVGEGRRQRGFAGAALATDD